jgi:hypothetical protein
MALSKLVHQPQYIEASRLERKELAAKPPQCKLSNDLANDHPAHNPAPNMATPMNCMPDAAMNAA